MHAPGRSQGLSIARCAEGIPCPWKGWYLQREVEGDAFSDSRGHLQTPTEASCAAEVPLLLNPYGDVDPAEHLEFNDNGQIDCHNGSERLALESAWIHVRQRIVSHVRECIQGLPIVNIRDDRIGRQKPPHARIEPSSTHVDQAQLVFVIMPRKTFCRGAAERCRRRQSPAGRHPSWVCSSPRS